MSEYNSIGDRIRALREARELTQAEVAKRLSVKRETVNQWENNVRDLKTQYTIKLANLFGVTCDEILRGIKAENVDINKRLGLENQAIETLKYCSESKRHREVFALEMTNKLLSDKEKIGIEIFNTMWKSLFAEITDVSLTDDGKYIEFGINNSNITSYTLPITDIKLIFMAKLQEELIAWKHSLQEKGEIE